MIIASPESKNFKNVPTVLQIHCEGDLLRNGFVVDRVLGFGWLMSDEPIIEEAKPAVEKIDIQVPTDRGAKYP